MSFRNKLKNTFLNDYEKFKVYYVRKLNTPFLSRKYETVFIEELPFILENTTDNKYSYLKNRSLYFIDNFINTLINNIDKLYKCESFIMIFNLIYSNIKLCNISYELYLKLIIKLIESNKNIDSGTINTILYDTKEKYNNNSPEIIEAFIKNKNTCNGTLEILFGNFDEELCKKVITKNFNYLLENIENVFLLKKCTKFNEELLKKTAAKIDNNFEDSITKLVRMSSNALKGDHLIENYQNYDSVVDEIKSIIKKVCKNEKVSPSQIEYIGQGAFSIILSIGEKVIKIGWERGTKTFPNNPYINAMLLRKEYALDNNSSIFVEVAEKVDTSTKVEEEELYQLYKKVRDIGLIWYDVAFKNVGRLKKENTISWETEIKVTDQDLGLEEYIDGPKLKIGDIVIIDNDHIFRENIKMYSYNPLQLKFEERYQQEKLIKVK